MLKTVFAAIFVVAVSLSPAAAQLRGSFASTGMGHSRGVGRSAMRHFYPPLLLGDPYYYTDDIPQPAAASSAPQVIVVQMPATVEAPAQVSLAPLLIEWQNDRYVKVGDTPSETEASSPAQNAPTLAAKPAAKPIQMANHWTSPPPAAPQAQPVVLVYRDGHREQVHSYTITGGVLYANGNYWTDGYWNKKIELAMLDLPATQQASQEGGTQFVLPSSPNEVIARP
jgi:hypothetical protein